MKRALIFLAFTPALFSISISESQALLVTAPFNGYVNKSIAQTITKKLYSRGVLPNDPAYLATLSTAESVIAVASAAGSVAATVGAIGSAPVWLSVALGIGAAYEVYDFTMGQFAFHVPPSATTVQMQTGTVNITPPPPAAWTSYTSVPPVLPTDWADPGVGNSVAYPNDLKLCSTFSIIGVGTFGPVLKTSGTVCGNTVAEIDQQVATYFYTANAMGYNGTYGGATYTVNSITLNSTAGPTKISCAISPLICPEGVRYQYDKFYTTNRSNSVDPGSVNVATRYQHFVFNNPNYVDNTKAYTLNDAAVKLQPSDLNTRADPELLAAIANKIWQQAAQQVGYIGAPYDPANPVTAADVLADIAAGLYPHPTVRDLLALVSQNAQTPPRLDPEAVPIPETEATAKVDLGPDPGIGQPTLEETPTGNAIVAQVMGLLPSLSGFTMPAHTSTCEAPTFSFFNSTQTMQPMCDLLEQQRLLLSTIFGAMWGIASLAMVLKA